MYRCHRFDSQCQLPFNIVLMNRKFACGILYIRYGDCALQTKALHQCKCTFVSISDMALKVDVSIIQFLIMVCGVVNYDCTIYTASMQSHESAQIAFTAGWFVFWRIQQLCNHWKKNDWGRWCLLFSVMSLKSS